MTTPRSIAEAVQAARQLIDQVRSQAPTRADLAGQASLLVPLLLQVARWGETARERDHATRLDRLMNDEAGLAFAQALTDRAFRPRQPQQVVRIARRLLHELGTPRSLPLLDRLALGLLDSLGPLLPGLAAAGIARRIRGETEPYLIPGQWQAFTRHARAQHARGLRLNVNRLGEEVLNEHDAKHHVEAYLELLSHPEVSTISVKISAICSHVNVLAWSHTLQLLQESLLPIYQAALQHTRNGSPKLVYLDMESYRDLPLNLQLFQSLLDRDDLLELSAGVVLQAYIPESARLQRELTQWARNRVERGGAPIRLRIAKGANLGMENIESSLRGWPRPTYRSKHEVDANYKRLLEFGTRRNNAEVVHLGVASHNLFDIAYAALLRAQQGSEDAVGFEMLQGMADPLCRAVQQVTGNVLIYAPMVSDADFNSAIAYLVRRFDEATAEENFLRHSFSMASSGPTFERERQKFLLACLAAEGLPTAPLRDQDRTRPSSATPFDPDAPFQNEPDTDFSRPQNREWLQAQLARWQDTRLDLPLHIAGNSGVRHALAPGFDPSRPGALPYRYSLAGPDDIEHALAAAQHAQAAWGARPPQERARVLHAAADQLRALRGELIATMVLDAGKRVEEADIEVSEAIDFAEYYARSLLELTQFGQFAPRGVTVVTPPWNFPLAIPLGGTLAALAAGNTVILKPAPETVLVAERAAHALWRAGIPREALQLLSAEDDVASQLITDSRVATVILTGATSTAKLFRSLRPGLHLCAETGGKNAFIVSASADRELAIKDVLTSAFGHAGQKCSAASLLILEADVYDDARFLEKLAAAARDLVVAPPWDPTSFVTPLIRAPHGALQRGLTRLDEGETWLVEPQPSPDNPLLWSPGIKLGVTAGSFSHTTELFGPVLSVLRAEDLTHALQLANGTDYGLTAGLHSLDEDERDFFLEHMNAGNLYVNRTTTGAIVRRQPFGGRKASNFGPGMKAGGPSYLLQLMRLVHPAASPTRAGEKLPSALHSLLEALGRELSAPQREDLARAAHDYHHTLETFFRPPSDPFGLLGQDNLFVHQPWPLLIRLDPGYAPLDFARVVLAARTAQTLGRGPVPLHLSVAAGLSPATQRLARDLDLVLAPSALNELVPHLRDAGLDRVRALGETPQLLYAQLADSTVHIAADAVCSLGRIELLHHLREQSRCITTHRYGNLRLYRNH